MYIIQKYNTALSEFFVGSFLQHATTNTNPNQIVPLTNHTLARSHPLFALRHKYVHHTSS